jgi:hypothetical protein
MIMLKKNVINLTNKTNMRFKVKPKPMLNDIKTVIRFAWFPIRIENTVIWLEKYQCIYIYTYDRFWSYFYWKLNYNQTYKQD